MVKSTALHKTFQKITITHDFEHDIRSSGVQVTNTIFCFSFRQANSHSHELIDQDSGRAIARAISFVRLAQGTGEPPPAARRATPAASLPPPCVIKATSK
jgi:hypothetical protein